MAVHSNFGQFGSSQKAKGLRIAIALQKAQNSVDHAMKAEAFRALSGGVSQAELNRRGNPFGRKRGRSTQNIKRGGRVVQQVRTVRGKSLTPLLPINAQTKKLRNSIRIRRRGGGTELLVATGYAAFVLGNGGTKFMVDRTFQRHMDKTLAWNMARARRGIIQAIHS
jgi:hypothetical protein